MLVLIGSYLLLVFVLPVALSVLVSYRALPLGRDCPHCRGDTLPLLAPRLRALSAVSPFCVLQRRWCLCCGWEGTARVPRQRRPDSDVNASVGPQAGPAAPAVDAAPARPARSTQTLDVRSLDVDGAAWRVMLQCWNTTGLFYGRFIFVGPSGRLWLDAVESFSGASETDVLGQALSMPDGTLESRLRRLVSDC